MPVVYYIFGLFRVVLWEDASLNKVVPSFDGEGLMCLMLLLMTMREYSACRTEIFRAFI